MPTGRPRKRLGKKEWFEHALRVLDREGSHAMRVEVLARELGVTKGSFYWHFRDRRDFLHQMMEYWVTVYTESGRAAALASDDDPAAQLEALFDEIETKRLTRWELGVRSLARTDQAVSRILRRADRIRFDFVHQLFRQAGFRGVDAEVRARLFVSMATGSELTTTVRLASQKRAAELRRRTLRLLLTPSAKRAR